MKPTTTFLTLTLINFTTSSLLAANWAGPATGGVFEDAANWNTSFSPGGPGSPTGESVQIPGNANGNRTVTLSSDLSTGNPTGNIRIDASQGASNTTLVIAAGAVLNSTSANNTLLTINEGGPNSSANSANVEVAGTLTVGQIRMGRDSDGGTSTITISAGGVLNMTGGGQFDMRAEHSNGTSVFAMTGGTFTSAGNRNLMMGSFNSTLDFSGTADFGGQGLTLQLGLGQPGSTDTINVTGSDITQITFSAMNLFAEATGSASVNFTADAGGISAITSLGLLDLDGTTDNTPTLNVDLSAYSGTDPIILFEYGTLNGVFETANIPVGATIDYNFMGLNQVALVLAVPEPSTSILALTALALVTRRRRS